jgi:hypothetical protein
VAHCSRARRRNLCGPAHELDEVRLEGRVFADQRVERAEAQQPAFVDDRQLRAQTLDYVEHVRRQHDGDAARGETREDVLEAAARHRVDALERLVEEDKLGRVNQRRRERELLLHAERVVGHQRARRHLQVEQLEQLTGAAVDLGRFQAVHAADEAQVLLAAEQLEQRHVFGHHTDAAARGERVRGEVVAEHRDGAGAGRDQRGGELDERGLAGAIAPDQSEEAARRQREADAGQRHFVAEALRDLPKRECGCHTVGRSRARSPIS